MPTRSLKIKEIAYKALKSNKKEGESFSDVILRLTEKKGTAHKLLEMIDEIQSAELADNIDTTSRKFRTNFKTRDVKL